MEEENNFSISYWMCGSRIITGIILILLGVVITVYGWNFHKNVEQSFGCHTCSIFDKECPVEYNTEENKECLDRMEWPFKFSLIFPLAGIIIILLPFIDIGGYMFGYFYEERRK